MSAATVQGAEPGHAPSKGVSLEVRPDGVVPLRRAGRAPYRVLLYGGGAMVGWGLLDHDRGLPGMVADRVTNLTGHGIDLDVIVEIDPTRTESLALLHSLRIARYDAVVVLLGEHAALDGLGHKAWAARFGALATALHSEASKASPLLVFDSAEAMVTVSSSGFRRRRALAGTARLAKVARDLAVGGRIRFAELDAPTVELGWGRQFSTSTVRDWANDIARALVPELQASTKLVGPDTAAAVRDRAQDERFRQRAVDSMRLRNAQRDGLLDAVARQAKAVYRASDSFVSIVDGPRVWHRAGSGSTLYELPRELAFCDLAVRTDRVTLLNDTSQDPRFDGWPVVGDQPIAFYAGEPIHTVDGYRIGALCITDTTPRQMRPEQLGELHMLAGRIERELWATALGARR